MHAASSTPRVHALARRYRFLYRSYEELCEVSGVLSLPSRLNSIAGESRTGASAAHISRSPSFHGLLSRSINLAATRIARR